MRAVLTGSILAMLTLAGCTAALQPDSVAEAPPPGAAMSTPPAMSADRRLDALADRWVNEQIAYDPVAAYFVGVPTSDHGRWADKSPAALKAFEAQRDALLVQLQALPAGELTGQKRYLHAAMVERLEVDRALRVCRSEYWDVNHMGGWQIQLDDVAREQPVTTAAERAAALQRWGALPAYIDREIANARSGLADGYSAPKSVVRRVIKQAETLSTVEASKSPYWGIADRSEDAAFKAAFAAILDGPVRAAFGRWHRFLVEEYLPKARESVAISANPNGRECYAASLRGYTTLARPPEEVFKLGQETVASNVAKVRALAKTALGTDDLPTIIKRVNETRANKFASEAEAIAEARATVERAKVASATLFERMPAQLMLVEPIPEFRRGTGASSYYERQVDPTKTAYYRIASERWASDTRGGAEITAVHEGYPGHHMQIAFAGTTSPGPIAELLFNSAYPEGWARYSEALAEEAGIYRSIYAPITRRLWPARGMVVDPGLHVMGWSREQAIAFLRDSGRFGGPEVEDMIDRIAVWPGQLTAYDSGGLEIMALRRQAEEALGKCFDLKEFHSRVLETGIVPLSALRGHIEEWIAAKSCLR